MFKRYIAACIALLSMQAAHAQNVKIIKKAKTYKQTAANDSSYTMVELKSVVPRLVYDLHYATSGNFTGRQLYKKGDVTFMRLAPAKALAAVQTALLQKGYGLKIWDAYRPHSATKKMWDLIQDERYVANPAKGSGHNRGLSVDLTLIDTLTGKELQMGTPFDNFTDTAHHSFKNLPSDVLHNRALLQGAMEGAGFKKLQTEWWHYSWPNDKAYEVLDIPFKKLKRK